MAKKEPVKKESVGKKAAPKEDVKKADAKKTEPKKEEIKKVEPAPKDVKKVETKKVEPTPKDVKKVEPKKVEAKKEEPAPKVAKKAEPKEDEFKHLVRVAGTDIEGNKKVPYGLSKIVGIGLRTGEVLCELARVDPSKRIGYISDAEADKLGDLAENFQDQKLPTWLLNRRKDYDTGGDLHVISPEIAMTLREDLNRVKKIKSYKGVRHIQGLPVRGQRTRTSFRGGITVGVSRKKAREQQAGKAKDKK